MDSTHSSGLSTPPWSCGERELRAKWIVALGAAAYVVFAIASFPADTAYRWFAPDVLRLAGLQGTVWSGRAELVQRANSDSTISAGNSGRGQSCLRDRARGSNPASGTVSLYADVRVGNGAIALTQLRAGCSLSALSGVLPIAGIRGRISVDLTELVLQGGRPVVATGEVRLAQLTVPSLVPGSVGDSIAPG